MTSFEPNEPPEWLGLRWRSLLPGMRSYFAMTGWIENGPWKFEVTS